MYYISLIWHNFNIIIDIFYKKWYYYHVARATKLLLYYIFVEELYMNKGTVKWFNNQKGFGFISDAEGNDVFVHYTGLDMEGFKSLTEGQAVEFEVVNGAKGPQATGVRVI